jgi:hypothetical protein
MMAVTKILAGGVAAAALIGAAPASAQYYPGYGYGSGGGVGQVLNQVLGGGYGYNGYNGYNSYNQQAVVNQCAAAVQQRLSGGYGYNGYGNNAYGYNGYGYNNNGYGGGRVLGISRVEPRSSGLTVRGVATSGHYGGYGYNGQAPVDLTWRCKADYRGYIADIDISPAQRNYGYGNQYAPYNGNQYTPYNGNDYSQYGYRRY